MAKEIDWGQYFHPDASTTLWQQMGLVLRLSVPAILAEISSINDDIDNEKLSRQIDRADPPPPGQLR